MTQVPLPFVRKCKALLRAKCVPSYTPATLVGLEEQVETLFKFLDERIANREVSGILLEGPRGSGKTAALKIVLSSLKSRRLFCTRQMHGLLIPASSSHWEYSTLEEMIKLIQGGDSPHEKPYVIFILEEFDAFVPRNRQTLLYNLFDYHQRKPHNTVPFSVVGLTTNLEAFGLLETRVKSRFSENGCQILFHTPRTLAEIRTILYNALSVPLSLDSSEIQSTNYSWTDYAKEFNDRSRRLIFEHALLGQFLASQFAITQNATHYLKLAHAAASNLSAPSGDNHPFLEFSDFVFAAKLASDLIEPKMLTLEALSTLELVLLGAMKHLECKGSSVPYTFDVVFQEYRQSFVRSAGAQGTMAHFERPMAFEAFRRLIEQQLVLPVAAGAGVTPHAFSATGAIEPTLPASATNAVEIPEYQLVRMALDPKQFADAVARLKACPTTVRKWITTWVE